MVAVAVSVDNECRASEINSKPFDQLFSCPEVSDIGSVNEDGLFGPVNEMIRIQISSLNEKQILHDFKQFSFDITPIRARIFWFMTWY